jgi:polysaccharide biosynthesis protein PslH
VASLHNVDSRARSDPRKRGLRDRYRLARMARLERRVARGTDLTLAVSTADQAHFTALGAPRVELVANGVDDELFDIPPAPPDPLHILFFGQLSYEPNVAGLLEFIREGWPELLASEPRARLRIAGSDPPARLADLAAESPNVDVLGFVPSLLGELGQARLVLAPIPFGGGTRIKVLEALAAGRPVVGTAVGVEEIGFEHGRHGLVATGPRALAAAAADLLGDVERARALGVEGRRLAHGYRWSQVTRPAERAYAHWIGNGAA